jgi:MFS family permease
MLQMLLLFALLSVAQNGLVAMAGFWANAMFNWTQRGVSILMFAVAAAIIAMQILAMPVLFRKLKTPTLLLCTLAAIVAGCLAVWGANANVLLAGASAALLFCGITAAQTVASTMLSNTASEQARGQTMGLMVSAGAAGRVIGPPSFGLLFVSAGPQWPFIAVLVLMIAFVGLRLATTALERRAGHGGRVQKVG